MTSGSGGKRPVGRAALSEDADARDWADTGDAEFDLDRESADDSAGQRDPRGSGDEPVDPLTARFGAREAAARAAAARALSNQETTVFARPNFDDLRKDEVRQYGSRQDAARQYNSSQYGSSQTATAPSPEPRRPVRASKPPRRPPLLVQGLWPALLAGGLALSASFGLYPLAAAVLGVQIFLILGALALLDAPASGGAFLLATVAVVAADAVVLLQEGSVSGLAGVAAAGLVGSLAHQLARRGRSRVTESLADTLVVLVVAVGAACLLGLYQVQGGPVILQASLAAAGAVLLVGRVGDVITARPELAVGSTRGWLGLMLGFVAGVAAAVLVAEQSGELPLRAAVLLALVVASTVATADLGVDLGAAELRAGWRDARRVAALRPTALLLPYAVLGPVALLAGRLLLT